MQNDKKASFQKGDFVQYLDGGTYCFLFQEEQLCVLAQMNDDGDVIPSLVTLPMSDIRKLNDNEVKAVFLRAASSAKRVAIDQIQFYRREKERAKKRAELHVLARSLSKPTKQDIISLFEE